MVAGENPFDVPALLSRALTGVCSAWSSLVGVDALLWSHIDTSMSLRDGLHLADSDRRLGYQFAAYRRNSRDVELHLRCQQKDLRRLQPYLRDMADRWSSIDVDGQTWRQPFVMERSYFDTTPPLSFPALRDLTVAARDIAEDSTFDLLECAPAVQRLRVWLEANAYRWTTWGTAVLRLTLPVPAVLTSLCLTVDGVVGLDTRCLRMALERCSATLETLDIRTNTTLDQMEPVSLPRLRELSMHGMACSLLQVLRTQVVRTLWVEEAYDLDDSTLDLLWGALETGRLAGHALRLLQLTNSYHHDLLTSLQRIMDILDRAHNVEQLAVVCKEDPTYAATVHHVLSVLARTRDGPRLPHLRMLTLALGDSAGDATSLLCLGEFLDTRDRPDLHLITDMDYPAEDYVCTFTLLEDEPDDGYYLDRDYV